MSERHEPIEYPLDAFLPPVRDWFRETFADLTPPQALGWPAIQRGEHTLILSPTGSGKTLAAFLWGIDQIWREDLSRPDEEERQPGVRLLYVSPLKALNNDVERNLRVPLAGIRRLAEERGAPLPPLEVLVRTGDTPQSLRRRMVKDPPHILITTPESLYLILTSPLARDMFRPVHTLIVDEIHTLVANKRGVHLALSLERLVELGGGPVQRIGLSATQRPLDEVACFLGGAEWPEGRLPGSGRTGLRPEPRPVTVVDAGLVKPMDLQVVTAVDDFAQLPGGSIWPAVIPRLLDLIAAHRTTLIFANSRRQAERAADRLNDVWLARQAGQEGGPEALAEGGVAQARGFQGTGTVGGPFRAHHGSVSREARLGLEESLKAGRLPALVGTSSLELGIDIGAVDLVVQLQSPSGVARGLQRVGRSGHLVGQTSAGRFFPTHREDLLETLAIIRGMLEGDVEPGYAPQNSLDVLAQQIVAMVGVQDWDVPALFDLVRRAYPYHKLTADLFHSVLDMLTGRYPSTAFRELRPRIAWDRVHDRLTALPGSRLLAIRNGGTIPDRGAFGAYLTDGKTRLGELDEEFVYETMPGDVFTLGASTWRVQEVTEDRVVVTPAPGQLPRMPFWKGDAPRRDYHLGRIYGRFRRELAERAAESEETAVAWLQAEFAADPNSAQLAVGYVRHQVGVLGAISSDRTVIAELFTDPLGDLRLVIHSCFGARVNSPWALALASAFREAMAPGPGRLAPRPEVMVSDDGILFRFLEADRDPPLSVIAEMGPAEARERLLAELPDSALFGAQFRMNAARALLLPGVAGRQKRTPFWLQRLRAKDLLAAARGFEDFPIVAETYRDCLRDVLDLRSLEEVLADIDRGEIELILTETVVPSPVAAGLLYDLISQYMYEWDQPKAEGQMQALMLGREMLAQLLDEAALPDLLRPDAVRDVEDRLQRLADGARARTAEELATLFLGLGDLSRAEADARSDGDGAAWVDELAAQGRLVALELHGRDPQRDARQEELLVAPGSLRDGAQAVPAPGYRYVLAERADEYRLAFGLDEPGPQAGAARKREVEEAPAEGDEDRSAARRNILRRVLSTHGPLTRDALLARYPWPAEWLDPALAFLVENGDVVSGQITAEAGAVEFCDRRNLERIHRATLALLRKEVEPVPLYAYADFLARWTHLHPAHRLSGPGALVRLLQQMRGLPAPGIVWERDLLPLRLEEYDPAELEALCQRGEVVWAGSGGTDPRRARVRFFFRGEGHLFLRAAPEDPSLSSAANQVKAFLEAEGACFLADLEQGTDLSGRELGGALVELVMAGLVTNDSLQALRQVLAWGGEASEPARKPLSSLEAELATWRRSRSPAVGGATGVRTSGRDSALGTRYRGPGMHDGTRVARPSRGRLHAARRAVTRRMEQELPTRWPGRWGLVHRIGVWGRELAPEERVARQARQLLQAYGIVTRQSLAGDPEGGWDWPALYRQFQLMEMRGEVRRGYFVEGLPGVQFALPEAVERLREWTHGSAPGTAGAAAPASSDEPPLDAAQLTLLNACDPANLFGPSTDAGGQLEGAAVTQPEEETTAEPDPNSRARPGHGPSDGGGVAAPLAPGDAPAAEAADPARFVRVPSNYSVLLRGRPVLTLETGGDRAKVLPGLRPGTAVRALRLAVEHAGQGQRRLAVAQWNAQPVLDSDAASLLEAAGFRREALIYVWDG